MSDQIEKIIQAEKHFYEVQANPITISNKVEVIEHSSQFPGHSEKIPIRYQHRLALALIFFMGLSAITILVQTGAMSHEQAKQIIQAIVSWML
jgi:hypothetical protein